MKPRFCVRCRQTTPVAPRRGAWVETFVIGELLMKWLGSHPAGVRGLKHQRRMINPRQQRRTPQGCVG